MCACVWLVGVRANALDISINCFVCGLNMRVRACVVEYASECTRSVSFSVPEKTSEHLVALMGHDV